MPADTLTRLELERYALGDLAPERAQQIDALAARDPALQARLERIVGHVRDAGQDLPPLDLPADAPERSRWRVWGPALAAALALVAVVPVAGTLLKPDPAPQTFRGGVDVQVWRVRAGAAEPQSGLIQAQAGDRIQLEVQSDVAGWLSVYNVQDDGQVQTYLAPMELAPLQVGKAAVVLDDYTGAERIFVLVSADPIDQTQVLGAVQSAWDQPLTELDTLPGLDASQRSLLVLK